MSTSFSPCNPVTPCKIFLDYLFCPHHFLFSSANIEPLFTPSNLLVDPFTLNTSLPWFDQLSSGNVPTVLSAKLWTAFYYFRFFFSPAVNFINIFCAHFLYKYLVPKATKLAFVFEILAAKILYEKKRAKNEKRWWNWHLQSSRTITHTFSQT